MYAKGIQRQSITNMYMVALAAQTVNADVFMKIYYHDWTKVADSIKIA